MKEIKVTIDNEGNTEVAASGMPGISCVKETEAIEKALGETTADKKTAEFYGYKIQQQQTAKS